MRAALLLSLLLAGQDEKADRIRRAIEWFADADPQVRELGRKELRAIGPEAVPHLEKLLEARDAIDIYRLLREVEKSRGLDSKWVGEAELPSEEEIAKGPPALEKSDTERYVRQKLGEARAAAKRGHFQRGYDIAHALLLLEPQSRHADAVRQVRKYCDNWITQTSLVRSRVVAPASGVCPGKPELMLRLENVFRSGVKLLYDRGTTARPSTAVVVVEITCDRLDPNGTVTQITRTMEVAVEPEIPVALGAQWERVFELDTGLDFADDGDAIRVYTVGAWTQPAKIEYGLGTATKRILFEPATIRVVPRKHEHMLGNPMLALGRAIDAGTVNEVFVAAMLIPEDQKTEAARKLVEVLERAQTPEGRTFTAQILTSMTGQRHGVDPKRWRAWVDGLSKEPARK